MSARTTALKARADTFCSSLQSIHLKTCVCRKLKRGYGGDGARCAYRKSDPPILMVQSAQDQLVSDLLDGQVAQLNQDRPQRRCISNRYALVAHV